MENKRLYRSSTNYMICGVAAESENILTSIRRW